MSDNGTEYPGGVNSVAATIVATAGPGGLIDVGGMTFDQLSAAIGPKDLGRALDRILAAGQNGSGYHGFSNYMGPAR
jgi:hypothetical protein